MKPIETIIRFEGSDLFESIRCDGGPLFGQVMKSEGECANVCALRLQLSTGQLKVIGQPPLVVSGSRGEGWGWGRVLAFCDSCRPIDLLLKWRGPAIYNRRITEAGRRTAEAVNFISGRPKTPGKRSPRSPATASYVYQCASYRAMAPLVTSDPLNHCPSTNAVCPLPISFSFFFVYH